MPRNWKHNGGPPRSREQRSRGRQPTARALSADTDAGHVDAEGRRIVVHPLERAVAVLETRGERMLGRESVLDRDHDCAEVARHPDGERELHVLAAADEAAAMDVEKPRRTVPRSSPSDRCERGWAARRPVPVSHGRRSRRRSYRRSR